jgi:hypothetical protein
MSTRVAPARHLLPRILLGLFILFCMYLFTRTPTHEGEWSPLQTRLPQIALHEGAEPYYHIENLRDFRYNADGSVQRADYRSADFAPADLQQVWLGISHFGGYGLAHTLLSFEFTDDQFLAVSVEARLRPGQSYHPFLGLLRQYNKMVVLGTEADIIGLRTHIRNERVLLYPLQLTEEERHYLFQALLRDAQQIAQQPDFYNTLLDNCTTNLLKHDPDYRFYTSLLDYRLLLPGFSDEVIQEKGWLATDKSIMDLRARATINAALIPVDAEDFSQGIREGYRTEWHQPALETSSLIAPNK